MDKINRETHESTYIRLVDCKYYYYHLKNAFMRETSCEIKSTPSLFASHKLRLQIYIYIYCSNTNLKLIQYRMVYKRTQILSPGNQPKKDY